MVGFCLDTCHAHAGGIALDNAVDTLLSLTGRIDLVHANDSRDAFDSGADRHTSFGEGLVNHDAFVNVVRSAVERCGAPVIVETPGPAERHKADFAWLRARW
jgi:deoxyribonuclease IV